MTFEQIAMIIPLIGSVVAIFISLRGNKRTDNSDLEKSVVERTRTEMKLDALIEKVDEIKESLAKQDVKISSLTEKYGQIDAKVEKLHVRVDALSDRMQKMEDRLGEVGGE